MFGSRFGPRYAMLPPAPLTPLAIGQSDLLPYYFKVSTDARETMLAATEIENPQRLLAGRFDLAFVAVFLYPLLMRTIPSSRRRSGDDRFQHCQDRGGRRRRAANASSHRSL
jgi:hypothetical protein